MVMVYMGADDGMRGGGSLRASLGPAAIDPLGGTYVNMHGCHLSGYIGLYGVRDR